MTNPVKPSGPLAPFETAREFWSLFKRAYAILRIWYLARKALRLIDRIERRGKLDGR